MSRGESRNISILFHGIYQETEVPEVNRELFISTREIEELILELKDRGFQFCGPDEIHSGSGKCLITFDDGYFNNTLFFPLAEKYQIPFMIFLSSFYSTQESPYIWDICSQLQREWDFLVDDYEAIVGELRGASRLELSDLYRPFRLNELQEFEKFNLVTWGNHTHTHRPWLGRENNFFTEEANLCNEVFMGLSRYSRQDFAFPNGLYDRRAMSWAKRHFSRVYTIDAGPIGRNSQIVDRISLVSPSRGLSLIDQVVKQSGKLGYAKRKYVLSRYRLARRLKSLL